MWQDYVITVGNLIFIVSLVPSVVGKNKPAFLTSMLSGLTLTVFVFTFITLKLWFSAAAMGGSAILWYILAFQVLKSKKKL